MSCILSLKAISEALPWYSSSRYYDQFVNSGVDRHLKREDRSARHWARRRSQAIEKSTSPDDAEAAARFWCGRKVRRRGLREQTGWLVARAGQEIEGTRERFPMRREASRKSRHRVIRSSTAKTSQMPLTAFRLELLFIVYRLSSWILLSSFY